MYLFQHVQEPHNSSSSLLDLGFTDKEGMISDIKHLPGLESDHICLQFTLIYYGKFIHDNKHRYNLHQADFDRMWTLLEANEWDHILSSLDIYQAWDVFASCYESILEECIPYQVPKMKKKSIHMIREVFFV